MCKMFKGKSQQKKIKIVFITLLKKHAPVVRRMAWPWMFRIVTGLFPSQQLLSVIQAGGGKVAEKPVTGER